MQLLIIALNKHSIVVLTEISFATTVERTTAVGPEYGGICYRHSVTSGRCDRWTRWGHIFGPLRCFMLTRKASMMSNSAESMQQQCLHTKAVNKRPHYAGVTSLSIFGVNFVLAKVGWGLISVHCSERIEMCLLLSGSKCISSMVKSIRPSTVQRLSAFRRVCYWRFYWISTSCYVEQESWKRWG